MQYTTLLIYFDQNLEETEGVLGLNCIKLVSLPYDNWQSLCRALEKNRASKFDNSS